MFAILRECVLKDLETILDYEQNRYGEAFLYQYNEN
jgi:hypothetical protein